MSELPKAYIPQETEERWYQFWEKNGYFRARVNPEKTPYTIVIPPPNITGHLHMGHVLNNTIQDIFTRWKRMQGFETLWLPGTDHAGIATQNVVEKSLLREGKTRHDIGREEFLRRVWKWREEYGGTIIRQLRTLGTSCDWERERFTMDEGLSDAVQEIFLRLFQRGLVYRGKYIVNWCPKDHTAISDDEVNHADQDGHLWYLRYPVVGSSEHAVVATTRPETMLGDTAVAVHPDDERYRHLIGKRVTLPLTGREIPVIADDVVDPGFGTGMVKVTPAHDPNDYWIAVRYNAAADGREPMPFINIFDISARLNENVPGKYRGMDRFEARKEVIRDLEAEHRIEKTEPYRHAVGRCYRCDTIIEPYLSDQWFVKMKPLAEKALEVVRDGRIRFHPGHWAGIYDHWMTNIRDWCISRQLWWGHRIPVWYCEGSTPGTGCNKSIASKSKPDVCPHCGSTHLRQDEDVLDTWFSSWLWPFSTLGWPKDNPDLRYFYPTNTLVTAPDIIFFWVARMVMAGMEVMPQVPLPDGSPRNNPADQVPFHDVYITSIIRDAKGRKMSKSLGNSPDPLDVIAEYGADALRFTIVYVAPLGQDVLYSNEKCEIGRNFANKLWNAGRFLLMNRAEIGVPADGEACSLDHLDLAERWILSRLHSTISELADALDAFEINQATKILYEFIWHDFCDWYVEMMKGRLYGDESNEVKRIVLGRALGMYETMLRLLHPFMPFVTEELWHHLGKREERASIMVSPYPVPDESLVDRTTESEMAFIQNAINGIRNIRGELTVPPSKEIRMVINFPDRTKEEIVKKYDRYFFRLAKVTAIERLGGGRKPRHAATTVVEGGEIFIPLEGIIDLDRERERMQKEVSHLEGMLESAKKKLGNDSFVRRAPQEVVEKEREKLRHFSDNLEKMRKNLLGLGD